MGVWQWRVLETIYYGCVGEVDMMGLVGGKGGGCVGRKGGGSLEAMVCECVGVGTDG